MDIKLLEEGYLTNQFDYSIKQDDNIDYTKLIYDDYHHFNYYVKRFKYYHSLPGLEQHIHEIVLKNKDKTPLDEINEKKELDIKINNLKINNND